MVDSNIQREELLPSERAFALKMKLEAMTRQGKRTDLTSSQNGTKLDGEGEDNGETITLSQNGTKFRTAENIGAELGMSRNQVYRYIRLTELIPELLDLVDKKRLQFTCVVDISYFDKTIQKWLNEYIRKNVVIKPIQIVALRERTEKENIDQEKMIMILHNALPGRTPAKKVVMNEKKLRKYFPEEYTRGQMEFNYLYGKQAEQFAYVNIPKALIHEEAFSDVSLEANMLYGLIMERMGMYRKNKWQDEQGRVYVLYPVKDNMEDMNRSEASVSKYLSELEDAKLLERVQSAPGRPCKLYLKKLSYVCGV